MTDRDASKLSTGDAEFVRRVAGVYAPPPETAASRARFDARLAARLDGVPGRSRRGLPALAAAAVVALAIALAWVATRQPAAPAMAGSGGGEVILALALAPAGDPDADLPDDYRAISELLAE